MATKTIAVPVKPWRVHNYETLLRVSDGEPREQWRRSLLVAAIIADLDAHTDGWPRLAAGKLFVLDEQDRPHYLKNTTALFAWFDRLAGVSWQRGGDYITQARFFDSLVACRHNYPSTEAAILDAEMGRPDDMPPPRGGLG